MLPVELPETDQFSPRTFDPDDEFSEPGEPARPPRGLGERRARPRRRSRCTDVSPGHERHAPVGRVVLVPAPLHRSDLRRSVRAPRQRAVLDGPPRRRAPGPSRWHRSLRGRRRARGVAPALRPLLAQGALRPRAPRARSSRTPGCTTRATSRPPRSRTSGRSTSRPPRSKATSSPASPTTANRSPASGARWARA